MDDTRLSARNNLLDEPRWVETRDLLARDDSLFLGDPKNYIVWSDKVMLGSVVGKPEVHHLHAAVSSCNEILAFPENIDYLHHHLAMLNPERASILKAPSLLTHQPLHPCRFLQPGEISALSHLPEELHTDLSKVEEDGKDIYAAFDQQLPVAFCYVAAETETLWDISIDTIESHQRCGFGRSAAAGLIHVMNAKGKSAVWGSLDSNPASLNLALKLGFNEIDQIWVLTRLKPFN